MKELLHYLATALVDKTEGILVEERQNAHEIHLLLRVNKEDLGKVIGKKGRTAKALRMLLGFVGQKQSQRIHLEIVEPEQAS